MPSNRATQQPSDPAQIRSMFASIASHYDRANTILSAGVHHRWRQRAVQRSAVRAGDKVLDCATGTGDLAIAYQRAGANVTGTDFTPEMIALARIKAPSIRFEVADVTSLPFDDGSFDIASMAFGIRNVADPVKGIAEMARVAKKVVIVEFGQPRNAVIRRLYDSYRKHFLARLGGAVTGQREAYEYLESSASTFPSDEQFAEILRTAAPFSRIDIEPLSFGIAWLYVAHSL